MFSEPTRHYASMFNDDFILTSSCFCEIITIRQICPLWAKVPILYFSHFSQFIWNSSRSIDLGLGILKENQSLYVYFLLLVHLPQLPENFWKTEFILRSSRDPRKQSKVLVPSRHRREENPIHTGALLPCRSESRWCVWRDPWRRVADGQIPSGREGSRRRNALIWFSSSRASSAGLPSGRAQAEVRGRWNPWVWSLQVGLAGREDGQGWRVSMWGGGGQGREAFGTEAIWTYSLGSFQLAHRKGRRRKGRHLVSL